MQKKLQCRVVACLLAGSLSSILWGPERLLAQGEEDMPTAPRVFLDCDRCDFTYIRRQIPFINYVRDPGLAQIHVLVTDQETASGGRTYRLAFIGQQVFAGFDQELRYTALQSDTEVAERSGFVRVLRMGLMPYLSQTALAEHFDIAYQAPDGEATTQAVDDPWNYWVFSLDVGGGFETEESQHEFGVNGGLRADRTTALWKIVFDADGSYEEETFEDDDRTITSTSHEATFTAQTVYSLSERWSAGLEGEVFRTTYTNIAWGLEVAPAIEYNLFPWAESDRRAVTLAYFLGVRRHRYIEETIFNQTAETRLYEALRLDAELIQPWGELEVGLEASHYFHDPGQYYRLEAELELSVRITRGLELFLEGQAEGIHDQLYLPKGEATLEEILLQRRQLATTYAFSGSIGLSFTFGSIYNNVVNPRF